MSIDVSASGSNQPRPAKADRHSFFSLYKRGQGYWTRLGTAIGAAGIILFIAWFAFDELSVYQSLGKGTRYGIAAGLAAVLSLLVWWVMNAPKRAQFLIDTDSELKKVNWAGWSELVASTRIVVVFMLAIALTLFVFDTQFHAFFHSIDVFMLVPNGWTGLVTGVLLGLVLLATAAGLLLHGESGKAKTAGILCVVSGLGLLAIWVAFAILQRNELQL